MAASGLGHDVPIVEAGDRDFTGHITAQLPEPVACAARDLVAAADNSAQARVLLKDGVHGIPAPSFTPATIKRRHHKLATGSFWHNRLERNGTVAIREGYDILVDAGNLTNLRIPGWAEGATVSVNGEVATAVSPGSYASLQRSWKVGDAVVLDLPLEAHFMAPDSRVDAVRDCLAVEREPLVYAFEHADQAGGKLESLRLDAGAGLTVEQRDDLLGGVATVVAGADDAGTSVALTGIPYYAWASREIGPMRVWVPTA